MQLTDGLKKGRLVVEKDAQTLLKVKRWISQSVAPMLAVIYAEHPGGQAWVEKQISAGAKRWKERHRRLLKTAPSSSAKTDAGGDAGAPLQRGEGVS